MYVKWKWKWKGLALAFLWLVATRVAYASDPIDATITVTPNVTVDLALSVTTYAFGPLDIGVSSVTASSITLRNTGNVDVTVNKSIVTESSPPGWNAATILAPFNGPNKYALFVATAAARPNTTDFVVADHLFNGTTANDVKGIGSNQPTTVTTSGGGLNEVYLWFRLDMPTQTGNTAGHEITMRFDAIAKP